MIKGFTEEQLVTNNPLKSDYLNVAELFDFLSNINNYDEQLFKGLSFVSFNIGEDAFYILNQDKYDFLSKTSLHNHKFKNDEIFNEKLKESLKMMSISYPEEYKNVKRFVKVFINVEIRDEFANLESTLTSCTLPNLPYMVFLSEKAQYHIPPSNISETPEDILLTENIYHEAVHQAINLNILMDSVLPDNYTSAQSKKIPIPWRQNQKEERNKAWELDRTLHATIVYGNVLLYRLSYIKNFNKNDKMYNFIGESLEGGIFAFKHLVKALMNHKGYFSTEGIKIIERLNDDEEIKRAIN